MPPPGLLEGATAPKIEAMNYNVEAASRVQNRFENRGTNTASFFRGGKRTTRRKGLRQHLRKRKTRSRKQKGGGLTNYVSWGIEKIASIPQGLRWAGESAGSYGLRTYERIFVDKSKQVVGAAYEQAMLEIKARDRASYDEEVGKFTRLINVEGDTPSDYSISIAGVPFRPESYVGKNLAKSALNSGKVVTGTTLTLVTAASYLAPSLVSGGALALLVANPVVGSVVLGAVAAAIKYATANVVIGANRAYIEHTLAREAVLAVSTEGKSEAEVLASIKEYVAAGSGPLNAFSSNQRQRSIWVSDLVVAVYGAAVSFALSKAIKIKTSSNQGSMFAEAASPNVKRSLDSLSLTKEDFDLLGLHQITKGVFSNTEKYTIAGKPTKYYSQVIVPKFEQFRQVKRANHVIDVKLYDEVFTTSDIHADYRKLLQLMENCGLITLPAGLDPYAEEDIYNPRFIYETVWNKPRTLFIMVGDIVDGSRDSDGGRDVDDPKGGFEFLLHCFLYNIRLEALKNDSEVLFVIGNHDLASVIELNDHVTHTYVHPPTWSFFGNPNMERTTEGLQLRQAVLTEFYKNCPYAMLSLENNGKKEAAFVHGGFHDIARNRKQIVNTLPKLEQYQKEVNGNLNLARFSDLQKHFKNGSLWTRQYQENTNRCALVNELPYNQIVVGHCITGMPTNTYNLIYESMEDKDRVRKCNSADGRGCVLLDCFNGENPKISYVDVAMSAAFRSDRGRRRLNNLRTIEVLKFDKKLTSDFTPTMSPSPTPTPTPMPTPTPWSLLGAMGLGKKPVPVKEKRKGPVPVAYAPAREYYKVSIVSYDTDGKLASNAPVPPTSYPTPTPVPQPRNHVAIEL